VISLTREEARRFMVTHHGLSRFTHERAGLADLLCRMRCLQLDPLSPMGTSPDMVGIARARGYRCGDWYHRLMPGQAFEHWAKERCMLPAYAFPYYRERCRDRHWWRLHTRYRQVPEEALAAVLEEVRERGPITAAELSDHGRVTPVDWSGWKGTGKMGTMALAILWTRCRIVVVGKRGRDKIYDLPERALATVDHRPEQDFDRWALRERICAAGLLYQGSGAHWSTISELRGSDLPHRLAEEGLIVEVAIEDSPWRYWAPSDPRAHDYPEPDRNLRILGPLDPFLWDRKLIEHIFGFTYIWEVYKPAAQRRWGWYVCPLLYRGAFVGRIEAKILDGCLRVLNLWPEPGVRFPRRALQAALRRQATACGIAEIDDREV